MSQVPHTLQPFRGRFVDPQRPVRVYRNLHVQTWSLRQGSHVVAHTPSLALVGVTFPVLPAASEQVRLTGVRTVCAFAQGTLYDGPLPASVPLADSRPFTYVKGRCGFYCDGRRLVGAEYAIFGATGRASVVGPTFAEVG